MYLALHHINWMDDVWIMQTDTRHLKGAKIASVRSSSPREAFASTDDLMALQVIQSVLLYETTLPLFPHH